MGILCCREESVAWGNAIPFRPHACEGSSAPLATAIAILLNLHYFLWYERQHGRKPLHVRGNQRFRKKDNAVAGHRDRQRFRRKDEQRTDHKSQLLQIQFKQISPSWIQPKNLIHSWEADLDMWTDNKLSWPLVRCSRVFKLAFRVVYSVLKCISGAPQQFDVNNRSQTRRLYKKTCLNPV